MRVAVAIDLNKDLILHPDATFFVRVVGDSMVEAGIQEGDILIVDRALQARNNDIVIAMLNGELTVKRMLERAGTIWLKPENARYRPIEIGEYDDFQVQGVAIHVIHPL